jgi:hypothetical protein
MSEVKAPHVYVAMVAVKAAISKTGISKTKDGPREHGSYKFRGIDDVYNALCEIEAQNNLMALPRIKSERVEYQTNAKGNLQTHVHLTMVVEFTSSVDGSKAYAEALGEGIDSGDKASSKAQSTAMKVAHLEAYKIPTEGLSPDIEDEATQVGPSLENKLEASVEWGNWESSQVTALQACASRGDLLETWSRVAAEGRGSPNGTLKRLAVVKDKMKSSLDVLQGTAQ